MSSFKNEILHLFFTTIKISDINIFRFVTRSLLPDMFNNTKLLLYIHGEKAEYLTKIVNSRLETYENALKLQPPIPKEPCTFLNSLIFVSPFFW